MSSSSMSAVMERPIRVTPSCTAITRSSWAMYRVGCMSPRSRPSLRLGFEQPEDWLCADQRDAGQGEEHADALHRLQALVEQEVGERDGNDREQAAEYGDQAQQAACGGNRERAVGA